MILVHFSYVLILRFCIACLCMFVRFVVQSRYCRRWFSRWLVCAFRCFPKCCCWQCSCKAASLLNCLSSVVFVIVLFSRCTVESLVFRFAVCLLCVWRSGHSIVIWNLSSFVLPSVCFCVWRGGHAIVVCSGLLFPRGYFLVRSLFLESVVFRCVSWNLSSVICCVALYWYILIVRMYLIFTVDFGESRG